MVTATCSEQYIVCFDELREPCLLFVFAFDKVMLFFKMKLKVTLRQDVCEVFTCTHHENTKILL